MLFEKLLNQFRDLHPDVDYIVGETPNKTLTISPVHPDFGEVNIIDDGDEITLIAGNLTHGHFSCYEDGLSLEEKENQIVEDTMDFIEAMFNDKVVFWGQHKSMGGWYRLDLSDGKVNPKRGRNQFVWSGPINAENG